MGRYSSSESYNQAIKKYGRDDYRLSWVVDRYYAGSRLRFPTTYTRDTDHAGAMRFAKKWDIEAPQGDSDHAD